MQIKSVFIILKLQYVSEGYGGELEFKPNKNVVCVISGFHCVANEIFGCLGHYAVLESSSVPDMCGSAIGSIFIG